MKFGLKNLEFKLKSVFTMAFTFIDNVMFDRYKTKLIHCPTAKSGFYKIPSSVTVIGIQAFARCSGLMNVQLSASVERIEMLAFHDCKRINTLTIQRTVNHIGFNAFKGCTALTTIQVQHTVPLHIAPDAKPFEGINFQACKLTVPVGSVQQYKNAGVWGEFKNIEEVRANGMIQYDSLKSESKVG